MYLGLLTTTSCNNNDDVGSKSGLLAGLHIIEELEQRDWLRQVESALRVDHHGTRCDIILYQREDYYIGR